ncbi:ubiquitin-like modifier-activating enzyme 6 [Plectropomus leopardus]|uniref:ubiquitin-like modifier-activating enzyme 6 n=1 Tax=Plectropomus leopardus TaxID=160734 RepID=UPI001C4D4730|nr:ubiquitin-like modifier-activating enzyme 6 [Plectropomus leopardus]
MAADSMEIDDSLYSRQRYVLGDSAMHQMAQSSVFLSGMGGLGIEIAKNIVLAGVKAVTLHDTKQCETWDLGSNFFIRKEDVLSQRTSTPTSSTTTTPPCKLFYRAPQR